MRDRISIRIKRHTVNYSGRFTEDITSFVLKIVVIQDMAKMYICNMMVLTKHPSHQPNFSKKRNFNKLSGKIPSWVGNLPYALPLERKYNHAYGQIEWLSNFSKDVDHFRNEFVDKKCDVVGCAISGGMKKKKKSRLLRHRRRTMKKNRSAKF